MNPIAVLRRQLQDDHVNVSVAWLEACVAYLQREQPGRSQDDMRRLVFQQLLHANLNDIRTSCLPPSVLTAETVTLTGSYFVQVEELRDISQPAYSQLRKLTGSENANAAVQAEPRETSWESKASRMLKLSLSDGVHKVWAFEYELVPALNSKLPAGTKLLICGPVECRRSTLFLTRKSVRILGGCVEALTVENSAEAILRRALGDRAPQDVQSSATGGRDAVTTRTAPAIEGERPRVHAEGTATSTRVTSNEKNGAQVTSRPPVQSVPVLPEFEHSLDGPDEDDELLGRLDIDAMARSPTAVDESNAGESVDEDALREQLDFQAEAAAENSPPNAPSPRPPERRYDTLVEVRRVHPRDSPRTVVIRGYVVTLTSKLKLAPDLTWKLAAEVSDDTDRLEVDVHDDVIVKMMGVTGKEYRDLRKNALANGRRDHEEILERFKEKLKGLDGPLRIEFSGRDGQLPTLIAYEEEV